METNRELRRARKSYRRLSELVLDHFTENNFNITDIEYAKGKLFLANIKLKNIESVFELPPFHFRCGGCYDTVKQAMYATAQLAMGHEIIYTCPICKTKTTLTPDNDGKIRS